MTTTLEIYTPPVAEPLSVGEAKEHLYVDTSSHNALIGELIAMARRHVEDVTKRQLVAATYRLTYDNGFPAAFELMRPPLIQVTSITYIDTSGDSQTLSTSLYDVDTRGHLGRVVPGYSDSWPSTLGHIQDVTVTYVAGYVAAFTAATDDTCTVTGAARTLTDADIVRLSRSHDTGDALPATLAESTDYHVLSWSAPDFELSATVGGAKIDITDTGTGTFWIGVVPAPIIGAMKLLIGHWFENREDVVVGSTPASLKRAVDTLLGPYRVELMS